MSGKALPGRRDQALDLGRLRSTLVDSLYGPVAVTLVFLLLVILLWIRHYDFRISSLIFMEAGHWLYEYAPPGPNLVLIEGGGYDGVYYYYAALDPLFQQGYPMPYRYRRFLYPFVVHILSLGRPGLIPYVMPAVNLAAVGIAVYVLGLMLQKRGLSPWYSLFLGTALGLIPTIHYNLTEPLVICLVVVGLYYYERSSMWRVTLFFALALITRETSLVVIGAIGLYELYKRRWQRVLILALSGVPFILLQAALYWRLGYFAPLGNAGIISLYPFKSISGAIRHITLRGSALDILATINFLPFLLFCVYTLLISVKKLLQEIDVSTLVVAIHLIIGLFFARGIWHSASNSSRLLVLMWPFLILAFAGRRELSYRLVFVGCALLTLMDVIRLIIAPGHPYIITS